MEIFNLYNNYWRSQRDWGSERLHIKSQTRNKVTKWNKIHMQTDFLKISYKLIRKSVWVHRFNLKQITFFYFYSFSGVSDLYRWIFFSWLIGLWFGCQKTSTPNELNNELMKNCIMFYINKQNKEIKQKQKKNFFKKLKKKINSAPNKQTHWILTTHFNQHHTHQVTTLNLGVDHLHKFITT